MFIAEIPAAMLQGIYFHKNRPPCMNYGAIGSIIGHEILHGFDEEGSKFDDEGIFAPWWTCKTKKQYSKIKKCLITQYNDFMVIYVVIYVRNICTYYVISIQINEWQYTSLETLFFRIS